MGKGETVTIKLGMLKTRWTAIGRVMMVTIDSGIQQKMVKLLWSKSDIGLRIKDAIELGRTAVGQGLTSTIDFG